MAEPVTITRDMTIEELVRALPEAVRYLSQQGIVCIMCGEPVWGTLAEVAREKGKSEAEIDRIVEALRGLASRRLAESRSTE